MGQSIQSAMSDAECDVVALLSRGAQLTTGNLVALLDCELDAVGHRVERLSMLAFPNPLVVLPVRGSA